MGSRHRGQVTRRRADDDRAIDPAEKSSARVPLRRRLVRVLSMGSPASIDAHRDLDAAADTDGTTAEALVEPTAPTRSRPSRSARSFDRFYAQHYGTVVRLAFSLCGSRAIAEELAQEAFVSAHHRWRRISRFDRPDLWVRRVVINRSISFRRRQASERTALERASQTRLDDASFDIADDEVLAALRRLSARQAEVLVLVYLEDRPIAEVAEILRLGPETVKTHLKRGRLALAELIRASRSDDRAVEP